jgi:hypothetical protein
MDLIKDFRAYTQRYEKRKRLTGKYSLQYRQYTVDLKILDLGLLLV